MFPVFFIFVLSFFVSCSKNENKQGRIPEETTLTVNSVKVTNDIDSVFRVQATVPRGMWERGNFDLGIVGKIEEGNLNISIPELSEEMIISPADLEDLGYEPEDIKINRLTISTSQAYLLLENPQSGGDVSIFYSNMEGNIDFYGEKVPFKKGWNFIETFEGSVIPNANVWTSLQDVYEKGYYKWTLRDRG
jgi:hypothetical protein